MTGIRHVVFDIGRVLIHYDPEIPYRRLIPQEERRRWFFANLCTPQWNVEQDRGRTWREAEDLLIARHPREAELIRAFRRHWHDMVPHHYEDTVALLERLIDAGRDVTLLTNFAADTFDEAAERFPFFGRPRGVTVSGRIGLIKPDRAIYDHHADTFGLERAATLLIDDSPQNVDGARAAGWEGMLYTGAEALAQDLERMGLLHRLRDI